MRKQDFVKAFSERTGLSQRQARLAINLFTELIAETAEAGDVVRLTGFGSFHTRLSPSRQVRNPRTGASSMHGREANLKFKPSRLLKLRLTAAVLAQMPF